LAEKVRLLSALRLAGSFQRAGVAICFITTSYKLAVEGRVTIDYLVKDAEYQNIDDETVKRMQNIEKINPEDKSHVYAMLDAFFAKSKLQSLLL